MKKYLLLLFVLYNFSFAQPPSGYYDEADGLTGFQLKTALFMITAQGHEVQPYGAIWTFFNNHEITEDGFIRDIFSDCDFEFGRPDETGGNQDPGLGGNIECEYYNREHSFPRAYFGGNVDPMFTDIHHIFPADKFVNNTRATYVFADVNNPTFTSQNGSKLGPSATPGVSGTVFEVADEYKGDIARAYFYMATRYENLIANWVGNNPDGDLLMNGNSSQAFEQWAIDLLYEWHISDPVDEHEVARNNAAFIFQGNRNPYIDNPDYVCAVWGLDEANCNLSNEDFRFESLSIYPNPSQGRVNIKNQYPIEQLELYNLQGKLVQQKMNIGKQHELTIPQKGVYLLKLTASNTTSTHKIIVK